MVLFLINLFTDTLQLCRIFVEKYIWYYPQPVYDVQPLFKLASFFVSTLWDLGFFYQDVCEEKCFIWQK